MKVLFAVNNDNISDSVVKKYQKDYREIISYKNVYYFNAILKELQKDKTYDRVIISEDLEPFANNNYDTIDKFLFDKLDRISDEAETEAGEHTDIILICTDRRDKSDDMLIKLFGIGIYNAILGQDRSVSEVCNLINKPRTKKDAKQYYKIEADNVNYQAESENNVSEAEVQNILAHYKRLGKNEDKYVDSFNNIVSQYTDIQLKIIIKYLPMNVKAVLEAKSPKYQELVTFDKRPRSMEEQTREYKAEKVEEPKVDKFNVELLERHSGRTNLSKPILIPTGINESGVRRLVRNTEEDEEEIEIEEMEDLDKTSLLEQLDDLDDVLEEIDEEEEQEKKGRGRPKKVRSPEEMEALANKIKRRRGRPKKGDPVNLFDIKEEVEEPEEDVVDLFGIGENEVKRDDDDTVDLFAMGEETTDDFLTTDIVSSDDFNKLLTKEKKIVAFVGTTKNGTSFIVNNVAELLASKGISTAILDMTKSKNAYYIYTKNEESLRQKASNSIGKLKNGVAEGIKVNKNLSVYIDMPGEEKDYSDVEMILGTLIKNHSLVLIDCDFDTNIGYFEKAQEIFLIQSMDVLTIQPLTAFLRNLKAKNVLRQEKVKIVVNKEQKLSNLPIKVLIGGMAYYNDPSMSFMTELFDKDRAPYCVIPFELQTYVKYLEGLVDCDISSKGYSKKFIDSLVELGNMVYPLLSKQTYSPIGNQQGNQQVTQQDTFSSETNDTLNRMKNTMN